MTSQSKPNHLAEETSPYLLQHAHNPVDWYPWGQAALEKAKNENKPILLSIGYAACHWCHVMAHESFEDEATARLMNELFINIKVDREERPDLDKIYQTAHYVLSQQSGGWPLTVFLTPDDLTPFFTGTYFPREPRYQLPAFKEVLQAIHALYQNQLHEIKMQNANVQHILRQELKVDTAAQLNAAPIEQAIKSLQNQYDSIHGGFGNAPKFPQPTKIEFLLRNKPILAMTTLQSIANGGIHDQLGGGFFRYSVDAKWQIPHFEKMLYDNAQLLFLFSIASQKEKKFLATVRDTADWVMTMQSTEGGYYSSLDADSEGHEGKFYVWDKSELESLLSREEFDLIRLYYGLFLPANFEKKWHFFIAESLETVAAQLKITPIRAEKLLASATEKLIIYRANRILPACDKKILTSWNALMIKGMLTAGYVLQENKYFESARRALSLIRKKLWFNNRLLASYKDKKARHAGYVDDYVFLLDALIMSLRISWDKEHLLFALELIDVVLQYFFDEKTGGLYFTASDHEDLLFRPMNFTDEAIPSSNAVFVRVLLTVGHLLGEVRYLDTAERILRASWLLLNKMPAEHGMMLLGLEEYLKPSRMIVIRGQEKEIKHWRDEIDAVKNVVFAIPDEESNLPGVLSLRESKGKVCAYVCEGTQCIVVDELKEIKNFLSFPH
jgi:uncharacterized protein YyaL (SSP411 family)